MAFIRNLSREKFTVIDNTAVRDKNLSLKSLGLLVKLLSLPDNWQFSEKGLEAAFEHDGQASIRTGLKELETYGYLRRVKRRDEMGHIVKIEWIISERPQLGNPHLENPSLGNPKVDNPSLGNRPQLNTNPSNTNKRSTDGSNTDRAKPPKEEYRWEDDVDISQKMVSAISDWLEYKKERKEAYKPTGLKMLISQIKKNAQTYGDDAVIEVMVSSMGSGYKGICFDKLKSSRGRQQESFNPFMEMLREEEERKNGQSGNAENYVTV